MLLALRHLSSLTHLRLRCCEHCNTQTCPVPLPNLFDLASLGSTLASLELEDFGQSLKDVTRLSALTALKSLVVWYDTSCVDTVANVFNANQQAGGAAAAGHPPQAVNHHMPGPQPGALGGALNLPPGAAQQYHGNYGMQQFGPGGVGGPALGLAGAMAGLEDLAQHLHQYEQALSNLADGKAALLQVGTVLSPGLSGRCGRGWLTLADLCSLYW